LGTGWLGRGTCGEGGGEVSREENGDAEQAEGERRAREVTRLKKGEEGGGKKAVSGWSMDGYH